MLCMAVTFIQQLQHEELMLMAPGDNHAYSLSWPDSDAKDASKA